MKLDTKDIEKRERLAREIARTSESIRKKHRTLKTGRMEQEVQLEKHFKPVVEPLKRIAENIGGDDDSIVAIKSEPKRSRKAKIKKGLPQTSSTDRELSHASSTELPQATSTPLEPRQLVFEEEAPKNLLIESVFETPATTVKQTLERSDDRQALQNQLGPLGQEYIGALLTSDKRIDTVYGVYFDNNGTWIGSKPFDIDKNDNILVDDVTYAGTPGLFELIFKRMPDDTMYTEDDMQKYKSILLATNAHRRSHKAHLPILGNKGHKYKHIIAPLMSHRGGGGGGGGAAARQRNGCVTSVPQAAIVTDNAIDYVHWDDPNELVDRLRLLDASHRAGNNAHDNEFLSIIEELCEAGLIIN